MLSSYSVKSEVSSKKPVSTLLLLPWNSSNANLILFALEIIFALNVILLCASNAKGYSALRRYSSLHCSSVKP